MSNKSLIILNKYVKEFSKLNCKIKIVEKRNFYIIYFLDKSFYSSNLEKINHIFNSLKQKYFIKLNKNILYGYIYDFYADYRDFEDDIENGLCKDLTHLFFKNYKKLYYDINNISNLFNFKNINFFTNEDTKNSEFYNIKLNNNICLDINKKDYILDIGDLNGNLTAA